MSTAFIKSEDIYILSTCKIFIHLTSSLIEYTNQESFQISMMILSVLPFFDPIVVQEIREECKNLDMIVSGIVTGSVIK